MELLNFFELWWQPIAMLLVIVVGGIWQAKRWNAWYDHPATVAERNKQTYDAAHAYLTNGKCCCGRPKN